MSTSDTGGGEKPWKVVVAFVGVFIAGSIFGGVLALRINRAEPSMQPSPAVVVTTQTPAPTTTTTPPTNPATPGQTTTTPTPANKPANPVPQVQLPPGMAIQAPQLMRRYVDRLDLTAEQKDRIHPLILRATNDLRRQQQTNFRETGIILAHLQEDLAKELTAEQRARLDEMAENQRRIIEAREKLQQEKSKKQDNAKPERKDGTKPKAPGTKPVDDGN